MSSQATKHEHGQGGSAPNSYATLSHYNTQQTHMGPTMTSGSGTYAVPTYSPIGYNTLEGNSGNGYSDIDSAYGLGAGNCAQTYTNTVCNGN